MITFIEYLTEVMVDVDSNDPAGSMAKAKAAVRNPDMAAKKAVISNKEEAGEIKKNPDDPNKAKKLRINQMKQRLANDEKRLSTDEDRQAKQAGM